MAVGEAHTMALTSDGQLWAWGRACQTSPFQLNLSRFVPKTLLHLKPIKRAEVKLKRERLEGLGLGFKRAGSTGSAGVR